jgi:hypothetical protein
VTVETHGARRKAVDVRCRDRIDVGPLADARRLTARPLLRLVEVAPQEMPVQAVEEDDDEVAR